jgi:hypothetical protein
MMEKRAPAMGSGEKTTTFYNWGFIEAWHQCLSPLASPSFLLGSLNPTAAESSSGLAGIP